MFLSGGRDKSKGKAAREGHYAQAGQPTSPGLAPLGIYIPFFL